jgi:LAO/AO transport system kinase
MWALVKDQLLERLRDSRELQTIAPQLEAKVQAGALTPGLAAQQLIAAFLRDPAGG